MDIMDGMDTMDFPFDGRMDRFKDVTCCTCPFVSIASLSIKNKTFPDVIERMKTPEGTFFIRLYRLPLH